MSALINVTQQNLFTFVIFQRHLLVLASESKFVEFLWKNSERIYWIFEYCIVFYDLLLMLQSQLTSAYLLDMLSFHFYV